MRRLILVFPAMVCLALPATVLAESPAPLVVAQAEDSKARKVKKTKPKRECRRVRITGSRVKERVCKTPEEWGRVDDSVRENVDRAYEGSTRAAGGGDS